MDPEGSKAGMGRVRTWSRDTGRDPRDINRGEDKALSNTLDDAIQGFLDSKRTLKAFTLTNYKRQLENQVTNVIPLSTSLRDLVWDNGGRERVRELRSHIEQRGSYDQAFRVQKVLAQALDFAILEG